MLNKKDEFLFVKKNLTNIKNKTQVVWTILNAETCNIFKYYKNDVINFIKLLKLLKNIQ